MGQGVRKIGNTDTRGKIKKQGKKKKKKGKKQKQRKEFIRS